MLNTYLNDNQAMPYPFYGFGSLPFPMSCIVGLSICISGDAPGRGINGIFISSVIIAEDSVRLALCRHTANGIELVGMFYANTAGYYTYIPSFIDDSVYENHKELHMIEIPTGDGGVERHAVEPVTSAVLRFVYSDYAPDMLDTTTEPDAGSNQMDWDDHTHEVLLDSIIEDMQVFYSYVKENIGVTLGLVTSNGHIQIGTIPKEAIGTYSGEFYLDPSCVTYMPDEVYNYTQTYKVNHDVYKASQKVDIAAGGILKITVDGSTAYVDVTGEEIDALPLTDIPYSNKTRVTSLNGHLITGSTVQEVINGETTSKYVYPFIDFISTPKDNKAFIEWEGYVKRGQESSTVVLTITGTSIFPNCYNEAEADDTL